MQLEKYKGGCARAWRTRASIGFAGLVFSALWASQAAAQDSRDRVVDQREQQERIEQWRREQERRSNVTGAAGTVAWQPPVADERPCFRVDRVRVVAAEPRLADDPAVQSLLGPVHHWPGYEGACLGSASLERLQANLQGRLVARGYITSTLEVPPQDLSGGEFVLQLVPGLVEAVTVEGARPASRPAANALALKPGDVLNLRALEHTLENLGRIPSQEARFVVEPGKSPGASVVRVLPLQPDAALWRAYLGAENADGADYGDLQLTAQVGVDHALRLSDQLGLWVAHSQGSAREGEARPMQTSWYVYWSLPLGLHSLSLSHSRADYRRFIVGGVGRFRDAGRDDSSRLRWEWTFWRGPTGRVQVWAAASQRRARTYLDDIELISRRRLGSSVEQGLTLWARTGSCEVSMELEGAQVQRLERDTDFQPPTDGLPRSWRAGSQWACALRAGYELSGQAWVQRVAQPVDGSDLVVLGTRQTVRGHAASDALSGLGQLVLRQELSLPPLRLGRSALRASLALDWGRVHQPIDGGQAGRELAALALGLRWQAGRVSGQLVSQHPLNAPPSQGAGLSQARRDARLQASVRISL